MGGLGYTHPDVLQADCKGGICGRSEVSYTLMYYRQTVREVSVGGLGYHIPHTLMYYRQTVREVSVGGLGYHIPHTLMYYRQTVREVSVGGLRYHIP